MNYYFILVAMNETPSSIKIIPKTFEQNYSTIISVAIDEHNTTNIPVFLLYDNHYYLCY